MGVPSGFPPPAGVSAIQTLTPTLSPGTLGESFFLIKKWPEEEDGRYVFTAFHFPPCSLEVPSSKLENKFPTLLTCIDFSLLRAPPSSPLSAGPVVKPPVWVGLSGTSGERRGGQSTEQPAKLPILPRA